MSRPILQASPTNLREPWRRGRAELCLHLALSIYRVCSCLAQVKADTAGAADNLLAEAPELLRPGWASGLHCHSGCTAGQCEKD